MHFRFACSRDIFRYTQLLYGTGPFWKYSRSLSKELDLLLILKINLVLRAGFGARFNERGESCLWMLNSKSKIEVATAPMFRNCSNEYRK